VVPPSSDSGAMDLCENGAASGAGSGKEDGGGDEKMVDLDDF